MVRSSVAARDIEAELARFTRDDRGASVERSTDAWHGIFDEVRFGVVHGSVRNFLRIEAVRIEIQESYHKPEER
jgi:hypothetical protein